MKLEKIMKRLEKKFDTRDFIMIVYADTSGHIERDPLWEEDSDTLFSFDNWEELELFVK